GGTAPASATVSITAAGRGWTASNGGATWLKLSAASGNGNGTLSVSYDLTGLAQGSYSTKLTISASDGQSAVLPVTLTVAPPGIVLGANSVDFSAVNGAPVPSQVVKIDAGGSTAWSASSNTGWLSVSPASGTTPGTIVLNVNPAVGRLASGNYQGSATIQPANAVARLLPVTLKLTPATLQASTTSLVLGGPYGRDFSTNGDLKFSLNTATNSWSWGINNVPTWVTASATTGSVNQAGASISFRPYPALAKVGVNSQLLAGFSVVNGDLITTSILLSLNKDLHKLLPSDPAVALVATPTWRRLTRTITVSDNYGSFAGMRATSDQPWLALSINNNQLTMTADPAGMTANTLNTANITLYPNDGDAAAPEPVRVALWVGAAAPTAATRTALSYANVAADPLRPYIYVHNGGAYVDVYNIYSGAKEATIAGLGAVLGDMAVTPNGDTLYVVDASNSRLTALDLNARNIARQLPLAVAATTATRLKIIRPNGVELAVLSDGQVYLTASGARLPNLPLSSGGTLGASSDGTRVVQQDEGSGAVRHTSVSVDYTALNNGTLYAAKLAPASHTSPSTQGQDVFVGSDASRVYSAAASLKSCTVLNAADLGILSYLAIGDAVANNVKVGADGRIYCGGAAKAGSSDIYQFSSAGAVLQRYKLSTTGRQLLPRQMAVSGDGLMLIAITDDGIVTFVPVGP
ncbi:BACON domain-containing protein, partial [Duganella callida]|uniref:BACON domain-containing protein n=1 Tax=Duganella callida TaxID=2561932 RepID=UPI0014305EE2